jgi:hypothetical protein
MQRIYQNLVLIAAFLITTHSATAQISDTTAPVSVDPALLEIFNAKFPKEYTIAWQHIPGIVSFMNLKNYNQEKLKEFFETTTKSDVHRSQDFYTTFKEYAHNFKNV